VTRFARSLLAALAVAASAGVALGETGARPPPAYAPPPETSRFIQAPGVEATQRYCLTCHSADYVSTQPPHMPAAFWQNEVIKMRNAYGAPIPDDAAKAITDYLVATYSEPSAGRR
jgi:hypothetical protein